MKNNFNKLFSILLCAATLFMGVGYASINSISLNVSGEMITQAQDGVFITEVNYNDSLSKNVNSIDSKINGSYQTNLNSSITLTSEANSQITYDVTIYNSNDLTYVFDGVEYTLGTDTYNNENITFKLTNLSIGDVVNSKDDISFLITFYYKDSNNINDVSLNSILNFKFSIASYIVDTFEYTGNYETFIVPHDGVYKIELWGAQGGGFEDYEGGKGGYVSGKLVLSEDNKIYIYVGENGVGVTEQHKHISGGYNGGGDAMSELASDIGTVSTGGGATDIRIVSGEWNNFDSLKSRVMVASGGGGSNYYIDKYSGNGGVGGGLVGYNGTSHADTTDENPASIGTGGTQTKGGYSENYTEINELNGGFGFGGSYAQDSGSNSGSGGSGYYGGGAGHRYRAGGGGGSSFISGHNGCDAILESSTEDNIVHTGQSIHYSGYQFIDTVMIDGEGYNWTTEKGELIGMPTYDGTASMIGNSGNGYAKITFVSEE